MNTEQLIHNLGSVKQEARGIVDNIRAVRGDTHAALTMAFVHASTLTDVVRVLRDSSNLPPPVLEQVGEVYLHTMTEVIRSFLGAGKFESEAIDAAINDASAVEGSVQSMARKAWEMAEEGKSYGGTE